VRKIVASALKPLGSLEVPPGSGRLWLAVALFVRAAAAFPAGSRTRLQAAPPGRQCRRLPWWLGGKVAKALAKMPIGPVR